MKNIDLLAKACAPAQPSQPGSAPDVSKLSNEVIDRIADAVIAKLSTSQSSEPDPEPGQDPETPDPDPEGGEPDEHSEPE